MALGIDQYMHMYSVVWFEYGRCNWLQVEALSEVKQYKEALQALEVAAMQDKEFANGKDMKLMQKQLRAAIR